MKIVELNGHVFIRYWFVWYLLEYPDHLLELRPGEYWFRKARKIYKDTK
jgi:hypothetical protein